jgi:hypothetical protein
MKIPLIAISYFVASVVYCQSEEVSKQFSATDIVVKAHEALGDILKRQAAIRTAEDLESFKVTRSNSIATMKQLAAAVPNVTPPTDFVRKEIIGTAMRYRYELFPPSPDGNPYLAKVPEQFHDELRRLEADQPPEIAPLWAYITEITMPKEEDAFQIIVGSEPIDHDLKVVVSLGRRQEKPDLAFDADRQRTIFTKGAEYIAVSVEADETEGSMVLYSQDFPIPEGFGNNSFKVSDAIKINPETRMLNIVIPGVKHSYKLPAKRQSGPRE